MGGGARMFSLPNDHCGHCDALGDGWTQPGVLYWVNAAKGDNGSRAAPDTGQVNCATKVQQDR